MAVSKSITTTNTSLTITMSGFSSISGDRTFYFDISNNYGGSDYEIKTMPGGSTSISHTFYGLDPGEEYSVSVEMTAPSGTTYSYGPYAAATSGISPWDISGVTPYVFPSGETASVYLSGLPTVGVTRYLWVRTTDGSVDETFTINANSSTKFFSVSGLEEKTDYTFEMYLFFYPWGEETDSNIAVWTLNENSGYATGGTLSVGGITEKGCTLSVSGIPASAKYPRTLQWYGKEGTNGTWELLKTTTATSSAAQTHSRNDLLPLTYYEWKVSVYAGGELIEELSASCTTSAASGTLTAADETEYSVKLTLSGLATGVSYARRIKWYYKAAADSAYTQFADVSSVAQSASSASMVINTLVSNTSYSFKAEICDNSGNVLGTKTASATTKETVAVISTGSVTSASIKVIVSGLINVAYTRTFEWWYKRQGETDYVRFDETEMPASDTTGEMSKVFKPLIASTYYDFKIYIKKDGLAMKELTITARTSLDNSLVPDAEIYRIEQSIGSTAVKVYWDAPEHDTGAYYKIQYSTDDENFTDISDVMTEPPTDGSYTEVTLPALDTEYYIQVMSYFEMEGEIASKFSTSLPVYTFSVLSWDTEKVPGEAFYLTTEEWNKLVKVVKERLEHEDVIPEEHRIDLAVKGKNFTSAHFNQVLQAVKIFNPNDIEPVEYGKAVTAELLNQLIAKVNLE